MFKDFKFIRICFFKIRLIFVIFLWGGGGGWLWLFDWLGLGYFLIVFGINFFLIIMLWKENKYKNGKRKLENSEG